ncbi:MAG: ferredoxin [Gammaproteobacteria bacterium]|nr:ferredoxin [Gammaproteobacteria bacterium]
MTTTEDSAKREIQAPHGDSESMPTLPSAVKDAGASRELMLTLRHFYLGHPGAKEKLKLPSEDSLPTLLSPFRDSSKLRYAYPLFLLPPEDSDGQQQAEELATPIPDFLQQSVAAFAPDGDSAKILKDNLPWMERHIRQVLRQNEAPVDSLPILEQAGQALQKHIDLAKNDRARLQSDLDKLLNSVDQRVQILGYGRFAALHLLNHAIRSRVIPRLQQFQKQIDNLIRGLNNLMEVEWAKSDESIEPRTARDSIGIGGSRFDPAALSRVMDHARGTKAMPAEQRQRIEQTLKILEGYQEDPILVRFIHLGKLDEPWLQDTPAFEAISDPNPCAKTTEIFDKQAAKLAKVFSAARVAQLEIKRIYDPTIHDPWFTDFDWEAFSQDELLLVPAVIALESANRVAGDNMQSFSRLLNSGRPIHILVRVQPYNNPGAGADESPFQSFRTELGYLGIGHRQAVVSQSSPARHVHLLEGYLSALDATRTSLHIVSTGLRHHYKGAALNAWLVAGAALEGRVHPFFHINPAAGDTSAARMGFSENPQDTKDWPVHPFEYRDENGTAVATEIAFTFADYALLIEQLRDHFRLIPVEVESDAFIPVDEYLNLDPEKAYQRIPFIWAVDGNAILRRLIVSRELILACQDRQNYWRTLQEQSGVRNRYVDLAIEKTRAEEQAQAAEERQRLQTEHEGEVERVRNEAAGEAMQRLSQVLMGMDFSAAAPSVGTPATATSPSPAAQSETASDAEEEQTAEETAEEEDEQISFDEAWIDSMLCTSCNDCIDINQMMFVYNENKQAIISDPAAGSFAELVRAAEVCPSNCIHPGNPLNSEETGLEELIERAAPFNS